MIRDGSGSRGRRAHGARPRSGPGGVRSALVLGVALAAAPGPFAGPPILRFDEVRAGMRGTGRTVFSGDRVESFEVEILGTLPDVGPDQDLILVRLSGGPLASTGVLAGMSGSPVFVDGRLVGAIAYSWGFSKEAIAGVVPIEEVLAASRGAVDEPRGAGDVELDGDWTLPRQIAAGPGRFLDAVRSAWASTGGLQKPLLPLAVSGLGSAGVRRIAPELESAGLLPLQAGAAGAPAGAAVPLEPGSAVGVKLTRGDVDLTATGTLTWIEGDDLYAFGHPLFGLGTVDLPLTGARVEALLPSLHQSARLTRPLGELGAARHDRSSGVSGIRGATAQMIPVRVRLEGLGREHRFAFDVADHPLLSPLLLYVSLNGILAGKERRLGSATLELREGSVIQLLDHDDVALDNLFAGPSALEQGTGTAAYVLHLLLNNRWARPRVVGINLLLAYEDEPRTARIRGVTPDRYRVAAGEPVELAVALRPHRGPERTLRTELLVPPDTVPGPIQLTIGAALAVTRELEGEETPPPRDLDQLIRLVNQLRRNDRVYVVGRGPDHGVLLRGSRLPNLPPSAATVLTRPWSAGPRALLSERTIVEQALATDYAVEGAVQLALEVVAP